MGIVTLISSILGLLSGSSSSILSTIGDYFKQKADLEQAQINLQMQQLQASTDLAKQGMIVEGNKNIEQIRSTSSGFKQFIFLILLSPIILTCFDPGKGKAIFDSLNIVPEWYMYLVTTIYLAIWGITSPVIHDIVQRSRDYRLQKKLIKAGVDKIALLNAAAAVKGAPLTEGETNFQNQVAEILNKNESES